jgi:hypothetical protein
MLGGCEQSIKNVRKYDYNLSTGTLTLVYAYANKLYQKKFSLGEYDSFRMFYPVEGASLYPKRTDEKLFIHRIKLPTAQITIKKDHVSNISLSFSPFSFSNIFDFKEDKECRSISFKCYETIGDKIGFYAHEVYLSKYDSYVYESLFVE